jgi:hypothetical protein
MMKLCRRTADTWNEKTRRDFAVAAYLLLTIMSAARKKKAEHSAKMPPLIPFYGTFNLFF